MVARARSGARLLPEHEFACNGVPTPEGPVRVVVRTRWEDAGLEHPVPRELWIDVRGQATSLDAAVEAFGGVARLFGLFVGFVGNVEVGLVQVHLAYDASPDLADHEFLEMFLPDRRGLVTEGRAVRPHLLRGFVDSVAGHAEWNRLTRALGHYELALRSWFFGGETIALAHLFIAAENLTKSVLRERCRELACTEQDLARTAGIDPDDPARPRWRPLLHAWAREALVFGGDTLAHRLAREASDGLEHGFMDVGEVHRRARLITARTFELVRRTVLGLLPLQPQIRDELEAIWPRDVQSLRRIVRGVFTGVGDLAAANEEYPRLNWSSRASGFERDEDRLSATFTDHFELVAAEGVACRVTGYEVRRRTEPGDPPIVLSPDAIKVSESSREEAVIRRAIRDTAALMREVSTCADETMLFSSEGRLVPIETNRVDGLALQKLWRARSLFLAGRTLVSDGRATEAFILGGPLWHESVFLAHFAESAGARARLFLAWRRDSLRSDLELFSALRRVEPEADLDDVISHLENELGAGLDAAQAALGVTELAHTVSELSWIGTASIPESFVSNLLAQGIAKGLADPILYSSSPIVDPAHGPVLAMQDKTTNPALVTAAGRFLIDCYISCHEAAAPVLGLAPIEGVAGLRARAKDLAEHDYTSADVGTHQYVGP